MQTPQCLLHEVDVKPCCKGFGDFCKFLSCHAVPCRAVPAGHEGKVTGLVLLPNDLVVSCSEDRSLRVWDLKTMKQLHVSMLGHKRLRVAHHQACAHTRLQRTCASGLALFFGGC
jgi:WD40 repeat protein